MVAIDVEEVGRFPQRLARRPCKWGIAASTRVVGLGCHVNPERVEIDAETKVMQHDPVER
jgi:hypothetical protein